MKLVHLVLWFGVLGAITCSRHVSGLEKVSIGAIISRDTINGRVLDIAMRTAVDDINSDPNIMGDRLLSLQIHDSNYSGFLSIIGALQFLETDTVAIIGPMPSMLSHVLAHITNELQTPLLSPTALDPYLSPNQFPYVFQTAPSDLFQMTAVAEMVAYFGWTQVVAVFTDEEQSRNGITALGIKLAGRGCKISNKVVLPRDVRENQTLVKQELSKVKLMESRVLVVHTLTTMGPALLNMANELGLITEGYVWIATTWLSSALDSQQLPEIFNITQGVITLRLHTPDSKRKKAFVDRWNKVSNGTTALTTYGLYAYDTVWMIANALTEFFRQGNNISFSDDPVLAASGGGDLNLSALSIFDGGKKLLKIMLGTNMTGVTGPFRFSSERNLIDPSFDVLNIVGSQMRQIGYWSNYSGLSVVTPEILYNRPQNLSSASQKLNSVVWPGGAKQQPRGWIFPRDGRKLRVGVPRRVSFHRFVSEDDNTHEARGYCIDVFLAALKLFPYEVPFEFIFFGDGLQNPNYTELVSRIAVGEFDAAVGDIAIVTWRTKMVDFAQPYTDSGLVVVAPVKKIKSSAWAFLRPFTPAMWAATFVVFLVVGVVLWILEHRENDEFRGPPTKQLKTVLWFSFSTLFFTHRENTVSTLGRVVLVIWLFVILILQQSYTASLTSFLTAQQLSSPIKGIETLMTSSAPIGFQVGSYAENYLIEQLNIPKSRLIPLETREQYADALEQGKVAAIVDERPYMELFLSKKCQFTIAGQQFTRTDWGFAFKRDSPLALDMSTAILKLWENGKLENITEAWLGNRKACRPQIVTEDSEKLQLENTYGLFLIGSVSCIIALFIHFCFMYRLPRAFPDELEPPTPSTGISSSPNKKRSYVIRRLNRRCFIVPCNAGG